ncbi:MAG: ABC transporter substrate-binding protein [Clostridiales Family XIII bacterium]|nr:ABC transporter substrate-binding protein [Clostridiales Family XIII bacterium]
MKKKSTRIASLLLVAALTFSLAACGGSKEAETPSGKKADKDLFVIKTATRKDCTLAPYLIGDTQGFFQEEGIQLEFTGELASTEYATSVVKGVNDVADSHPNALANNIVGGADLVGVTRKTVEPIEEGIDPKFYHMWYYVNPKVAEAGVDSIAALAEYKGDEKIKVSSHINTCEDFILNELIKKSGVDPDRFEWIQLENDTANIQALKLEQIDLMAVHPTFYAAAAEADLVKIADSSDAELGEATGTSFYYFSNDFVKKNPEEVAAFVRAINKTQVWCNEHPEEVQKLVGEYIDQEVTGNHFYATNSDIPDDGVQPWLDALVASGKLEKDQISVSDMVTKDFVGEYPAA